MTFTAKSQEGNVEKSINGIQAGYLGMWLHNETRISKNVVLRSELGLNSEWVGVNNETTLLITPVIVLEPKWYYNIEKRHKKSKKTSGNSANFISLKTEFTPNWFVISNNNISVNNQIFIVPSWGLRRSIGDHFNYEVGAGVGYRYSFINNTGISGNVGDFDFDLHLRIGYKF